MILPVILISCCLRLLTVMTSAATLPQPPPLAEGCSLEVHTISTVESGLFLRCGKQAFRVTQPKNLYGNVHIADASAALRFVRLFTSKSTFFLVDAGGKVELCSSRCRPTEMFEVRNAHGSDSVFDAKVEHVADDPLEGKVFFVDRFVVGLDQVIYHVVERVTEYGNYDIRKSTLYLDDASKLGIVHIGDH